MYSFFCMTDDCHVWPFFSDFGMLKVTSQIDKRMLELLAVTEAVAIIWR